MAVPIPSPTDPAAHIPKPFLSGLVTGAEDTHATTARDTAPGCRKDRQVGFGSITRHELAWIAHTPWGPAPTGKEATWRRVSTLKISSVPSSWFAMTAQRPSGVIVT